MSRPAGRYATASWTRGSAGLARSLTRHGQRRHDRAFTLGGVLVGGLLNGGVSYLLEGRRADANVRASARLTVASLHRTSLALDHALAVAWWGALPFEEIELDDWEVHRAVFAESPSFDAWMEVWHGFRTLEHVRTIAADRDEKARITHDETGLIHEARRPAGGARSVAAGGRARGTLKPVPAVIDLRAVDLDELDIGSLTVDRGEHLTLDGDHAVSVRDTDPLAQGLFALLRNDCHADRLLVWQELADTLNGQLNDDGRLALAGARVCCDDLGAEDSESDFDEWPLSERDYKTWWLADEDRQRSWPSVSSVAGRLLAEGRRASRPDAVDQLARPAPGRAAGRLQPR
ncbi:MAG: hypothetical protein JWO74_1572 [Solirubrobacterales bacterium]|nr:hypothetical protein [Solirubrobacterales bacterium]